MNINLDRLREQLKTTSASLIEAINSGDTEKVNACLEEYGRAYMSAHSDGSAERIMEQLNSNILTARGLKPMTVEERTFISDLIKVSKSDNPRQALTEVPLALPRTMIDTILEDIRTEHPLLAHIDLRSTEFNVRAIYTESGSFKAAWGPITGKIVTELSAEVKALDSTQHKLTAFLPIPKPFIDFAPEWVASIVYAILEESYANGMEDVVINGTGKDQPIGMLKDLKKPVAEGVYSDKDVEKITAIDQETYPKLVAKLSKTASGNARVFDRVLLICNPADYLTKICPATTVLRTDGSYALDAFPFPTVAIQCASVPEGKAILGIENGYLLTIGVGKNGTIDYSDQAQFLDDNRVYTIKGYGNGRPKNNNSFVVIDISKLEVLVQKVKVVGTVSTKEEPAV